MQTKSAPRKLVSFDRLKPDFGINYSRVHLGRLERAAKFPRHVQVGEKRIAWFADEIAAWLESKATARACVEAA